MARNTKTRMGMMRGGWVGWVGEEEEGGRRMLEPVPGGGRSRLGNPRGRWVRWAPGGAPPPARWAVWCAPSGAACCGWARCRTAWSTSPPSTGRAPRRSTIAAGVGSCRPPPLSGHASCWAQARRCEGAVPWGVCHSQQGHTPRHTRQQLPATFEPPHLECGGIVEVL